MDPLDDSPDALGALDTRDGILRDLPAFKLYTGALAADTSDPESRIIKGVASSTIMDLAGDRMSVKALEAMQRSAVQNLTIFSNHEYEVPKNSIGSVVGATITQRGDYADLDIAIRLVSAAANPEAEQLLQQIREGVKIGLSIGARILDWHEEKLADARGKQKSVIVFDDVLLLETSLVGIPCNPRSWVQNALKSLRALMTPAATKESPMPRETLEVLKNALARDADIPDADETEPETPEVVAAADPPVTPPTPVADALKGLIAQEVAESAFRSNMWRLSYALESVVYDQLRAMDLTAMSANLRSACNEFADLADAEIARAQAAGVGSDGAADDDGDDAYFSVLPEVLKSGHVSHERLRAAYDAIALAMGVVTLEGTVETTATPTPAAEAATDLVDELTTRLAELETQKTALETEVTDLEGRRETLLKQGTGRPTQQPVLDAPLDIVRASNEAIAAHATASDDEFAALITR